MDDTKPKTTPKDFFLYLGVIVTLYVSTISVLTLIFEIINSTVTDKLDFYSDPFSRSIRFALASLIIIFPIYLVLSKIINKELRNDPSRGNIWVRKWLIYLTLFIAGGVFIGSLISILNNFLGGEITTRFILKALSMLIIMGIVFTYYRYDLKRDHATTNVKTYGTIALILVLAVIVSGFIVAGSPAEARKIKFDQERVNDLQTLQLNIISFWQSKEVLPQSLSDLEDSLGGFRVPKDPSTDEEYKYRILEERIFELCATFELVSLENVRNKERLALSPEFSAGHGDWTHGAGETCFEGEIDPDIYLPRKATLR